MKITYTKKGANVTRYGRFDEGDTKEVDDVIAKALLKIEGYEEAKDEKKSRKAKQEVEL